MAAVAAVLDGYGGWHVVVAPRSQMKHHVRPGQLQLIVPYYEVDDPPPYDDYAKVIGRAEMHALWWIGSRNDPDILKHPAVALFLLRRKRTYHRESVNLCDIVET